MPGLRTIARLALAALLAAALMSSLAVTPASAAGSVTFPSTPFDGVQVTFTVTGVELGAPQDLDPNDWPLYGAERDYPSAQWLGGSITVTGVASGTAAARGGVLNVSVGGVNPQAEEFNLPAGAFSQAFTLTVADPASEDHLELGLAIRPFANSYVAHTVMVTATIAKGASTTPPANAGLPPCAEAVKSYSLDPTKNLPMTMAYGDVQKQFDQAITRYETDAKSGAFAQDNILGSLPALAWLANQGGATSVINRQFVFASDADRAAWAKRLPTASEVTPGTERALYEDIWAIARTGKKLTPGDVLYLAIKERKGDVKQAMLLAHNMLRSLARSEETLGNVDYEWTFVEHNPSFIADHLTPLVDPQPLGEGQNSGSWYHLFGTAYFEMQARGEWGVNTYVNTYLSAAESTLNADIAKLHQQLADVLQADPQLTQSASQTRYSRLANEIEKVARKRLFGSPDDPLEVLLQRDGRQARLVALSGPPDHQAGGRSPTARAPGHHRHHDPRRPPAREPPGRPQHLDDVLAARRHLGRRHQRDGPRPDVQERVRLSARPRAAPVRGGVRHLGCGVGRHGQLHGAPARHQGRDRPPRPPPRRRVGRHGRRSRTPAASAALGDGPGRAPGGATIWECPGGGSAGGVARAGSCAPGSAVAGADVSEVRPTGIPRRDPLRALRLGAVAAGAGINLALPHVRERRRAAGVQLPAVRRPLRIASMSSTRCGWRVQAS